MKKTLLIFLTAALLLCCGCASSSPAASSGGETAHGSGWRFEVRTESYEDEYKPVGDAAVCTCTYQYPVLLLLDDGGNPYVGEDAAQQLAACDTFNARFRPEDYVAAFAELRQLAVAANQPLDSFSIPYSEDQNITSVYHSDILLSIEYDFYTYTGGAHGYGGRQTVNFDLDQGRFFDWTEISDDPAALRVCVGKEVAAAILREDMASMLFDDYEKTVATLEYAVCAFDEEGLRVTFPESVLGPHAAGWPNFHVEYEVFDHLLNERGALLLRREVG